ncbi:unnamed protein product [Adineta ricciae]|uniref:Pentapeptide repeat-containing protein n=1 Tax=Adineta ricciae TaxID=249248 RepID=A0A815TLT3_ADIRI|nr:unnamed protein product [Adineta ricciae]
MSTSQTQFIDPSAVQWTMVSPTPPSTTVPKSSRTLDVLKILLGFFIALLLAAILITMIVIPRSSGSVDLSASNEQIAKLQRESNENIARLQREFTENLTRLMYNEQLKEADRLTKREETFIEKNRGEDQAIQRDQRQQDLSLAMEQLRQHINIEERRIQVLLEDRQIRAEHRKEDQSRENADLLAHFIEEVISAEEPLEDSLLRVKIDSLLTRLDREHKSSLINFLYKLKYIHGERPDTTPLNLQGAFLKELDLDDFDRNSDEGGTQLDYSQLMLPSTILINASFKQISLPKSNFSTSNLQGAMFQQSDVTQADFSRATLTMSNFRHTKASESNFMNVKMRNALFENADLTRARLINSDLSSSKFQGSTAVEAWFSRSELSNADFQAADLSRVQMNNVSARSANFYASNAADADFSYSYLSNCLFQWANLRGASFRNAFLAGTTFENANVELVDFSNAQLIGVAITQGQLNVALSIANTILPDGSTGRNINLVNNSDAQCVGMNETIPFWTGDGHVSTVGVSSSTECLFQGNQQNATLQQRVDARRYERLIRRGGSKVRIEMQGKTSDGVVDPINLPIYMNVRFLDSNNNSIGPEQSTLNITRVTGFSVLVAYLPCPSAATELQLTLVFRAINATADNIYVTIE